MEQQFSNQESQGKFSWIKNSITLKMFIVGFLILIMLIPLSFIQNLITERDQTNTIAVSEINSSWGEKIQLYGPILKIPYYSISESTQTDVKTGKTITIKDKTIEFAYFFPENLDIKGSFDAEPKKRGIYQTSVYKSQITILGNYSQPNFQKLEINPENVIWDKAQIVFETTNVKGITNQLQLQMGQTNLSFSTVYDQNSTQEKGVYEMNNVLKKYTLQSDAFNLKEQFTTEKTEFKMDFKANGSDSFEIIPIGKTTKMQLKSGWKDASFYGEYLPLNPDKLSKNGFDAQWQVLEMNRPFSQQFTSIPDLGEFAFGVSFMIPVDNYQQNDRSAKYGYLVIALTFLLFFLIQTLSKINIHPFQYIMIGLALVIFYTLLLSISEQSSFNMAYILSGFATISLITLFSKSIMKSWKFPTFIALALVALYGFIFVIIQLESYALLVGSIGLFLILAAVMYASRKIEWS